MTHGAEHIFHMANDEASGLMEKFNVKNSEASDGNGDLHSAIMAMYLAGADFALKFAEKHPGEIVSLRDQMRGPDMAEDDEEVKQLTEDIEKILYGCTNGKPN